MIETTHHDRQARLAALGWISISERLPENGQEVAVLMTHGQIRQVVSDKTYSSGFKQPNCTGWECLSLSKMEHTVTHWRPDAHPRLPDAGPDDAPWRTANPMTAGRTSKERHERHQHARHHQHARPDLPALRA